MRNIIRLIKITFALVDFLINKIIVSIARLCGKQLGGTLVILNYHSVRENQKNNFQTQMKKLKNIGTPVFADIGQPLSQGAHCIALTFDDGFYNVLKNALPIIGELGIPATLFIPAGYLGKLPGWIRNPAHENAGEIIVSAEQLRALPPDLVKIGSHCLTHPVLSSLTPEQVRRELSESKEILEVITGREITLLSFPYDDCAPRIIEAAKQVGYEKVFSNTFPLLQTMTDGFLNGRVDISPYDWKLEYWLKLRGAYRWVPFIKGIRRGLVALRKQTAISSE